MQTDSTPSSSNNVGSWRLTGRLDRRRGSVHCRPRNDDGCSKQVLSNARHRVRCHSPARRPHVLEGRREIWPIRQAERANL